MPASFVLDCPECGASIRLKSPPAGKKLRCPQCRFVFASDAAAFSEADNSGSLEERPSGRRRSRAISNKRSFRLRQQWLIFAAGGLVILVVLGGIYQLAGETIMNRLAQAIEPNVDVQLLDLPMRRVVADVRVQDVLTNPQFATELKATSRLSEANNGLAPILGINWDDVVWMRVINNGPAAMVRPDKWGVMIVRANQGLRRPSTRSFSVEGITCYRLSISGETPADNGLVMFYANSSTAVIGDEAAIRQSLGNWKRPSPPSTRAFLPAESSSVVQTYLDGGEFRFLLFQFRSQMNLLANLPGGKSPPAQLDQALATIERGLGNIAVEVRLNPGMSWTARIQPTMGVSAAELQSSLETWRQQLGQTLSQGGAANAGGHRVENIQALRAIVNSPFQVSGDHVVLTVNVPPDQVVGALALMMPTVPAFSSIVLVDSPVVVDKPIDGDLQLSSAMKAKIKEFRESMQPSLSLVAVVYPSHPDGRLDSLGQQIGNAWGMDAPGHSRGQTNIEGNSLLVIGPVKDFPRFLQMLKEIGTVRASSEADLIVVLDVDWGKLPPYDPRMGHVLSSVSELANPDPVTYQPLADKYGKDRVYAVRLSGLPYNDPALAQPLIEALKSAGDFDVAISPSMQYARYLYVAPLENLKQIRDPLSQFGRLGWEYKKQTRGVQLDWNREQ